MDEGKGRLIKEQEPSVSVRDITSNAVEVKRRFLQTSKNSCSAQSGVARSICETKRQMQGLKLQMSSLSYSKGRCRYTNNEKDCIKTLETHMSKIASELKKLDAKVRKQQQKLK